MARPTKFTQEARQRILQAIQLGATYELAAAYGGISYELLRQWIGKGDKGTDTEFVAFFDDFQKAEGAAAIGWLAKIERAANDGNWQAAAWKLERRYPRAYGRTTVEHSGDANAPLKIVVEYADEQPKRTKD